MLLPFLRGWAMDEKTRLARIRGEQARTLLNIAARTELPSQQWWLSFAGDDGFHGVAIVHATGFTEALMETNLHRCNPGGEVVGLPFPPGIIVPSDWTYRILTKPECRELENMLWPQKRRKTH